MSTVLKKFLSQEPVSVALEETTENLQAGIPEEVAVVLDEPAAVPALTDGEVALDVVEAPAAAVDEVKDTAEVVTAEIEAPAELAVSTEEGEEKEIEEVTEQPPLDIATSETPADVVIAEIKSEEIQRDLECLVEAQSAMEAYSELLIKSLEDGGVNAQAAAFLRVGMERYEYLFGMEKPLTPAVESFGGSMSQRKATQISLEAMEDLLKTSWETIKKALEALWQAIQDYYSKLMLGVGSLEKKVEATEKRAGEAKGQKAAQDKVTVSNPGKLFANGEWMGGKGGIAELETLVDYVTEAYPKATQAFAADLAESLQKVDIKGLIASGKGDVSDLLKSDLEAIRKGFPGKGGEVAETQPLFGNKVLRMDTSSVSKLTFAVADGEGKAAPSSYDVEVASAGDLAEQAKKLSAVVGKLAKLGENKAAAKKAIDGLVKAGDALKKKLDEAEVPEFTRKRGMVVLREVLSVQKMLGTSYSGVLSYLVSVVNAQLAVVNQQLAVYKAEK